MNLLDNVSIELPSWAFGNSGTRFKVFGTPPAPAHRRGEDRRRGDGAPLHRDGADGRPAHPVGPGRRLHRPRCTRHRARRDAGDGQLQHLPRRRLQVRQPDPRGQDGPAEGDRPSPGLHRDHEPDRVSGPEDLAGRRHQLSRPGRHPRRQDRLAESLAAIYQHIGEDQRMVLEYKFFEPAMYMTDVPDWGHLVCSGVGSRRAREGLPRHRSSRARHQHRVHRRSVAPAREAGFVRLQLALLRRRRPHCRGRPIRSSCSASCSR